MYVYDFTKNYVCFLINGSKKCVNLMKAQFKLLKKEMFYKLKPLISFRLM